MKQETATFGAGCFWGVEVTFRNTPGVIDASVGYSGGSTERPTYEEVCGDETGHAEVVQVIFDPERVSYEQLVDVFFANHDPTTKDRQGPDVGRQYRSVIFYHDADQQRIADAARARWNARGRFRKPIVTEVAPAAPFWRAEEYHQRYLEKRGLASCHV